MELYIDLEKAMLNRGKLVRRAVQVHGRNGKMFTRMQWIDPTSGQPVMETHGGKHDHEKNMIENLSPGDKGRLAHRYLDRDPDRARLFVKHTGGDYKADKMDLTNHVASNLSDVPVDHLKPHMEGLGQKKAPKVGLQHTEHGLTTNEVNKRTGKEGGLDLESLSEGTMPYNHKHFSDTFEDWDEAKDDYHRVFGNTTVEGIEKVFSHPEGEFNAVLHDLILDQNPRTGELSWQLTLDLFNKDNHQKYKAETEGMNRYRAQTVGSKYSMGSIYRSVKVDTDGELHVDNEEFTLKKEHHGKGYASHIYNQSEQYWRHISKGYPVNITLKANISIGTYAWAKKGFDFRDESDLKRAHNLFRTFCHEQGINPQDVAKESGFNKASEIKHAWEFATLKYKKDNYDLKSLVNKEYEDEVQGIGHFGKAFMMGGLVSWRGKKVLNNNDLTEQVSDINERYSKKAKQE
jgi:GNAT superfamily N-acetyltransferase